MEIRRNKFQGVLNILSFNRHFYVFGFSFLILMIGCNLIFNWPEELFWIIMMAFGYGLLMPLIVSAFVYDFSGYYELKWLEKYKIEDSKNSIFLNINAGFDETSFIIKTKFPLSELKVFDFYNAKQHTEAAIVRARKASVVFPHTLQITTNALPLNDNSTDAIFLLSAAHEIRSHKEKVIFLKECKRVCKTEGKVIIVEHLRDLPNFVAFTIGFTHFFSKHIWRQVLVKAGFSSIEESKFTPFMSVFSCK